MDSLDNKCPACGATIMFNSLNQMWDCSYCSSKFTLEEMQRSANSGQVQQEVNMVDQLLPEDTIGDVDLYRCKTCGAEMMALPSTMAEFCIYCGSKEILKERVLNGRAPNYIIPFKTTRDDAISGFKNIIKGKLLMPKIFKATDNIEKIAGVYIPFWAYDLEVNGEVEFEASDTKTWNDSRHKYKKVDRYSIRKSGHFDFLKVLADASTRFPDDLMDSLEPYDYNDLVSYNQKYLVGFLVDKYNVGEDDCLQRVAGKTKDIAIELMQNTVGHSEQKVINDGLRVSSRYTHYIMLPVWLLNIKYQNKTYTFAMNGQTGKMVGNVPIAVGQTIMWAVIFFVILFVIGLVFVLVVL